MVDDVGCAGENGEGGVAGFIAIDHDEGFRIGREGPGPGSAVVVGGFAAGVFVAGVVPPVWMVRSVEQVPVVIDGGGALNRPVGEAANGTGKQGFPFF